MPRVEIIPLNWASSIEASHGDGTPTIDVCSDCACLFKEGEPIDPDESDLDDLALNHIGALVGSTDVEHPDFDGEGYQCEICHETLTISDN